MSKITYTEALNIMIQKGLEVQAEFGVSPVRKALVAKGNGCEEFEESVLLAQDSEKEQKDYLYGMITAISELDSSMSNHTNIK